MPPIKAPQERRRFSRLATLRDAKVFYGGGAGLGCVVRDISEGGARIELAADAFIPGELHLLDLASGQAYQSRIAWRRGRDLGLQFIAVEDLAKTAKPNLAAMRRIWMEHRRRR